MTAPAYATELADIYTEGGTTGWTAIGGGGSGLNQETDYRIQGSYCLSKDAWASATKGMIFNFGTGVTIPTDGAAFIWITHLTPTTLAAIAAGGIQYIIGSATTAYKHFYVGGNDTIAYGGWILAAVDPAQTADATTGSPTTTRQYFGGLAALPSGGPTKGSPFGIDCIRYGRGELRCTYGEAANYATFAGANSYGDDSTRRWGLLTYKDGAYYLSGLFLFGLAATAVDFRDSNKSIFIRNHPHVTSNFHTFEVRNASSNVELTNIVFKSLCTVSKGRWVTTNNATVVLTKCSFIDMGTFAFDTNTTVDESLFLRCDQITAAGANLTGSTVDSYTGAADSSALVWNVATDPSGYLDDMTFVMGTNAHHAIEMGTSSPTTLNLSGITFSGFNADDGENDSVIHVKRTTGDVTINASGCTGTVSYKSDGATVTVVSDPVTFEITQLQSGSEVRIYRDDTGAEIDGVESSGTTYQYGYTYSGDIAVHIHIHHLSWLFKRLDGITLGNENQSIPAQQQTDRVYST